MLYFLDPEEDLSGETFAPLPEWARQLLARRWPFRFIDDATLVRCIESRIYIGGPSDTPYFNYESIYADKKEVNLYLVLCEIKSYYFVKVGLTTKKNPLHRYANVYKKVLFSKSVPAEHAELIEKILVWKCKELYRQDPYDEKLMRAFAGKTESIFTTDEEIIPFFLNELGHAEAGIEKHGVHQVELELWLLNAIVNACYSERFLFSGHACSSAFQGICYLFSHGANGNRLSPKDALFAIRSLIRSLAPIVDLFWDKIMARNPYERYKLKKQKYEMWCRRKWPEKACDSNLSMDYHEWLQRKELGQPAPMYRLKLPYDTLDAKALGGEFVDYKKHAGCDFSHSRTYSRFRDDWHNLLMKTLYHYDEHGNNPKKKKIDIKALLDKS